MRIVHSNKHVDPWGNTWIGIHGYRTPENRSEVPLSSPSRGGVFESSADRRFEQFTESISIDHRLFHHDIAGSIAHAQMLADQGILVAQELEQVVHCLREIEWEIQSGKFAFRAELEDIHMHIERALIDRIGDAGRKLHTGRSRNDQVSTDLRLWVRDANDRIDQLVCELQRAFLERCQLDQDMILPAYTHLRRAQPVLAAHLWLAYCEKFGRDRGRLSDCRRRVNQCGLGTAAVAGTSLNIDRENVARRLGFEGLAANSIDASSDRDFVAEFVFCLSMIAIHLSNWAEEWVIWSTEEFNFLELPQAFCSGSSIMPQKINPDALELTRGKAGRVIGSLQALLVLLKGLPLAYNRDLQEDKAPLFEATETVQACLSVAIPIVSQSRLNRRSLQDRVDKGFLDATTLMEYLISRGTPQRTAHHAVGGLVRLAVEKQVCLAQLSLEDFRQVDPSLDKSVYDVLGVKNAIRAFRGTGSTEPSQVAQQIEIWKSRLNARRA